MAGQSSRRIRWAAFAIIVIALATQVACAARVGPGDAAWNDAVETWRRDMDVGGFKLHMIDSGPGDGGRRVVVMIHGYGDSTYCWHRNFQPLVDAGFRVILVDQPGFGRSDIPPAPHTYSASNQADIIARAIAKLGVERYSLAGSSMGGGISLYIAATHPQNIERLVVVSPVCFPFDPPWTTKLPGAKRLAGSWLGRIVADLSIEDVYYDDAKVTDALKDEYARALSKPGYGEVLHRIVREFGDDKVLAMMEHYGDLTTPTLIVWGDKDKWVPPALGPRLRDALPNARLEMVPNSGHLGHQESPEIVNPLMIEFLKGEPGQAAP
ncbi:MAG: alpha/beta hydrolase [Deltaproteobacteria bacterium]|nr:alpha/beta hydrolase [Deltaproteobacteria bacterium]